MQEQKRPCTNGHRSPSDRSEVPRSHIGEDGRDLDWRKEGVTHSRCAGVGECGECGEVWGTGLHGCRFEQAWSGGAKKEGRTKAMGQSMCLRSFIHSDAWATPDE